MVLSILSVWSPKASTGKVKSPERIDAEPVDVSVSPVTIERANSEAKDNVDASGPSSPIGADEPAKPTVDPTTPTSTTDKQESKSPEAVDDSTKGHSDRPKPQRAQSRFSFRSLGFFYGGNVNSAKQLPTTLTHAQETHERQKASVAAKRELLAPFARSADRRAQRDALAVQRLIVGPGAVTLSQNNVKAHPVSKTQLTKIKSQLMQPKSANRLIAKLRDLPPPEAPLDVTALNVNADEVGTKVEGDKTESEAEKKPSSATTSAEPKLKATSGGSNIPIHAVCLESPDVDVSSTYFSKLTNQSILSSPTSSLSSLFSSLHIVDLLSAPNLGLGQPGSGEGLLAGAVPTAETVIEGATKLTPQLLALGFATGQAILPSHTGIHPPTDRMSILTYWWGLELCLPPPTLQHLSSAPNIAHQIINFLSALSLMNNGVREILPFVRYISQFVDFEWSAIEKQDKGKGVVCAATWIMPAAMVPRPWDFPDPSLPLKTPVIKDPTKPGTGTGSEEEEGDGVGRIIKPPSIPLPTLVVTPPSVIKKSTSQNSNTAKS